MDAEPGENDPIELEPSVGFEPVEDSRPRIDPPPPVVLLAVADCVLPCIAGMESAMDDFYRGILGFERDNADALAYRAENFRLRLVIQQAPAEQPDYRPLRVVVPSLAELIGKLFERQIEFTHQRGLTPGDETVLLRDPAGNIVEAHDDRELLF